MREFDPTASLLRPERPAPPVSSCTRITSALLAELHPSASSRTRATPAPKSSRATRLLEPSRAASLSFQMSRQTLLSYLAFSGPLHLFWNILGQLILKRWISLVRAQALQPRPRPDCLSVSSGFATDQYALGAPSGYRRPDFVPMLAHVARVRERASYWVEVGVRAKASWRATRSDRGEP
ncbi:hypothetical protein E5676_scaffold110G001860 [Cucumis melo var. makuwa]|uniref:Uncharacterized protein n=1 Tax=Cucumis melo var. makuwa TaxID=1194695 RepID=A0A5D3BC74_CUCMM|nr:hypothetical protein E6C27_scaffold20G001190 [Cucumis melo var. makuwa]TYJ95888.1 hypothetical protein E5676_scaffold110G001860 [Cucumis melo var. makuwa]